MAYDIPLKELERQLGFTMTLNIVQQYKWHTGLATDMPASHIPRLLLREFEIANNSTWSGVKRSGLMALSVMTDRNPYGGMYVCKPTGLKIILPYFNESVWKAKVNWERVDTGGENNKDKGLIEKATGGISKFLQTTTGQISRFTQDISNAFGGTSNAIVMNTPMAWKEGDADGLTTKFYLINTNNSKKSWYKNFNVCRWLKAICLHDQMTTTKAAQPPIYEAFIPGYRYLPAAAITDVTIKQIGSVIPYHAIKDHDPGQAPAFSGGKYAIEDQDFYVPDAWEIELTITPLVMASRQTEIMGLNPTRVEIAAITDTFGNAIDTQDYAPYEMGMVGEANEPVYVQRNARNLFDLNNGTQRVGEMTDGK